MIQGRILYILRNVFPQIVAGMIFVFWSGLAVAKVPLVQMKDDSTETLLALNLEDIFEKTFESGTGKAEPLFSIPLSATVVTSEEIMRSGATSIPEALRLVPGLIVREQTPGNFDVHIRGFDDLDPNGLMYQTTNTISLVMLNGRPIYNDGQGTIQWEHIPVGIKDIEKIEIIRGPAPAMLPNPANGVIHITTKKPLSFKEGVTVESKALGSVYAKNNLASLSATYNASNNFSVKLSGNIERRQRDFIDYWYFTRKATPLLVPKDEPGEYVQQPSQDAIGFSGVEYSKFLINRDGSTDVLKGYPDLAMALYKQSGMLDVESNLGEVYVRAIGGVVASKQQRPYVDNFAYALSSENSNSHFGQINLQWKSLRAVWDYSYNQGGDVMLLLSYNVTKAHDALIEYNDEILDGFWLQGGVSMRYSTVQGMSVGTDTVSFNDAKIYPGLPAPSNTNVASFVKGDWTFGDFRAIAAARLDYYKYPDILNLTPQFTLSYSPWSNFGLRATISRGARSPFMLTMFNYTNVTFKDSVDLLTFGRYELQVNAATRGAMNKKLLSITNSEIGARWKVSDELAFDVEFYTMRLTNPLTHMMDTIQQEPIFDMVNKRIVRPQTLSYYTLDWTAQMFGGTLSAEYKPISSITARFFVSTQKTFIENYDFRSYSTGELIADDSSFQHKATPPFYGGAELQIFPFEKAELNFNAYFYGNQTFSTKYDKADVPANFLLNIYFQYGIFDSVKAVLNARNLLSGNKRQFGLADRIGTFVQLGLDISL